MPKTPTNPSGSRVVLYARVSTEEQAGEEHFSIDAQFAEMRETARKKSWDVVGEFVDEGISGTKRTRPQLESVLAMARNGSVDILMVHELSRLSRSVYHTLDIFDTLGRLGVGFASVRDPDFDFADPSKRLFLTIIAAINEHYTPTWRSATYAGAPCAARTPRWACTTAKCRPSAATSIVRTRAPACAPACSTARSTT